MVTVDDTLEELERSLNALAALDVDTLSEIELHRVTIAAQRCRDRLTAVTVPAVARWDARSVWAGNGARTAGARFAVETRSSKGGADAVLRRARALVDMPVTLAAAQAGELSIDVVDLVVTANTAERRAVFAELEADLVEVLRGQRYRVAARSVRYWGDKADALLGVRRATCEARPRAFASVCLGVARRQRRTLRAARPGRRRDRHQRARPPHRTTPSHRRCERHGTHPDAAPRRGAGRDGPTFGCDAR